MYANGEGVPEDDTEAVRWFRLAAEQGLVDSQTNLAVAYSLGRGILKNYVIAYAWFNVASASGDQQALEGRSLLEGQMTPSQIAEAQQLSTEIFERIQGNQWSWKDEKDN